MVPDLLIEVGPAIQAIFHLGYEPKAHLFYELSCEQYGQIEKEGYDISKPWFSICPKDCQTHHQSNCPDFQVVDENEIQTLTDAADYINRLCDSPGAPKYFDSFEDKLIYAAGQLPPVFSEASKYARKPIKKPHLTLVS